MAKTITLTKGKVTVVDDAEFDAVSKWKWYANETRPGVHYACRDEAGRRIYLHRALAAPPAGMDVDHADGDPMNNRRSNLRICTRAENLRNIRRPRKWASSRYVGVSYDGKCRKPWEAFGTIDGKKVVVGRFASEDEAGCARGCWAKANYGDFAPAQVLL